VLLEGRTPDEVLGELLGHCRRLAGDETVFIDEEVAASEQRTGERNRALAHFIAAEVNLRAPVDKVLDVYFHQCALAMTCRQLATIGRYLCAAGQPIGGEDPVVTPERARRINALMMTCGLYDASGEFAFRIGIPAKSGGGGGILGSVPGIASVAAWCPGLDEHGNSLLAVKAFEDLVRATGWSVFGPLILPA
jgi:glutaminase